MKWYLYNISLVL